MKKGFQTLYLTVGLIVCIQELVTHSTDVKLTLSICSLLNLDFTIIHSDVSILKAHLLSNRLHVKMKQCPIQMQMKLRYFD